jgi:hypothetical protein
MRACKGASCACNIHGAAASVAAKERRDKM